MTDNSERPRQSLLYISLQAYTSDKYSVLWCKRDHAIGLRRMTGDKKQCMSFRSKGLSEEQMRSIVDD